MSETRRYIPIGYHELSNLPKFNTPEEADAWVSQQERKLRLDGPYGTVLEVTAQWDSVYIREGELPTVKTHGLQASF